MVSGSKTTSYSEVVETTDDARMLTDRKWAIERTAAYVKSEEEAHGKNYLIMLNGLKGSEMVWDLVKAMR